MIYGYIRVSTNKQNVESQKFEIVRYCIQNNIEVDEFIEEKISGVAKPSARLLGEKILNRIGKGDTIIVTEISRLSRSIFATMSIISHTLLAGARIILIWKNLIIEEDNPTTALKVFLDILNAAQERENIRKRTKAALQMLKSNGVVLGRPIGTKTGRVLESHKDEIIKMLNCGISKAEISRRFNVNPCTLHEFIRTEIHGLPGYKSKSK